LIVSVILSVGPAKAAVIVDTGSVSDPLNGGPILVGNVPGYSYFQWLAGKFTLGQTYTVTDIQGWISTGYSNSLASKLTLVVYGDGGTVPNKSNELYSGLFDLPGTTTIAHNWYGVSGLSLTLGPGSYWAAFETRQGYMYDGYMQHPVPNPLSGYAVAYPSYPNYNSYANANFGLKVQGVPGQSPVVPEPATMALFGIGGAAAAFMKRQKRT